MHACELLYVAATVSNCCQAFVKTNINQSSASLHQYWSASRQRLDNWTRSLAQLDNHSSSDEIDTESTARSLIEEILLAEVLTRTWTAASIAHDHVHHGQTLTPVARSIYLGHQQARNGALLAILRAQGLTDRQVRRLNVLRQKCERWTDLFLAQIPLDDQKQQLAFNIQRMEEFADDLAHENNSGAGGAAHRLTMASLESAAQRGITSTAPNGELNQKIASGVLGCLPPEAFDSAGPFTTLWQTRMEHTASDTLSMVEELLSLD